MVSLWGVKETDLFSSFVNLQAILTLSRVPSSFVSLLFFLFRNRGEVCLLPTLFCNRHVRVCVHLCKHARATLCKKHFLSVLLFFLTCLVLPLCPVHFRCHAVISRCMPLELKLVERQRPAFLYDLLKLPTTSSGLVCNGW